jgi:prepilin-type N-terminal cleavage/methylation domain-containing protein
MTTKNQISENQRNNQRAISEKGFTLMEFLIVIGIIVVLVSAIVFAINPGSQLERARDRQREAHINSIYLALIDYRSREGGGDYPACVGTTASDVSSCSGDLVPDYLVEIPEDPDSNCEYTTGYFVKEEASTERIGVKAMCAEGDDEITVGNW